MTRFMTPRCLIALVITVALVACSGDEPDASAPAPAANASPSETKTSAAEKSGRADACKPATFAPTYLPWQKSGTIPQPKKLRNRKDMILLWFGPHHAGEEAPHVDLATHYEDKAEGGGTVVPVRGTEGTLTWTPAFKEMALRWTERDKPCGHYGLYLYALKQSKKWAETEILRVAESLE